MQKEKSLILLEIKPHGLVTTLTETTMTAMKNMILCLREHTEYFAYQY
jgi:hypothetical protein